MRSIGFTFDVTERKAAEDELRQLEQKLRRAQRLEAMGTLAGGIAHDFNNILHAILGYGEIAADAAKKGTRTRYAVENILAAGERGRRLVDRILAFSRGGSAERVAVHVQDVVREALNQIAAMLPREVTVVSRLRAERAAMLGDSTQVHQVTTNLVSNALQAMPHGGVLGVELEVEQLVSERQVSIGTIAPGEYIVLRVSDAGTGIPPTVAEHMFDPFFTTKQVGVGSGLGLSLVHGIVVNVGGAIDVATQVGIGSTFTVYLPRHGDAPATTPVKRRPLQRGFGQRVLVVDDEEPLVRLATETLERLGYAPVGFTSSAEALAAFRADPQCFDAVLTDERMPGLSGTTLIREMRFVRGAIPVVLMSGYPSVDAVEADIVVRKPLSARELAASMARALHT
jgi:nitrogen-specific signal transduction histidine kinase